MVAIEDAVTVGCRLTGLARSGPSDDALGRPRRGRQQHVRVAAPELRVRLKRRVPAQRLGPPHVGGEGVDRARIEPVQAEAGRDHRAAAAPSAAQRGVLEVEELEHVARRDLEGLVGGDAVEEPLRERPRIGPVALDVREVGGEHDVLHAHVMAQLDGHPLHVLHAEVDVLPHVVARPLLASGFQLSSRSAQWRWRSYQ